MKDFRDHIVERALDETVRPYLPEKTLRARLKRMAVVAALTIAAVTAFWVILHYSSPRLAKPPADRKPVPVELLSAPDKR